MYVAKTKRGLNELEYIIVKKSSDILTSILNDAKTRYPKLVLEFKKASDTSGKFHISGNEDFKNITPYHIGFKLVTAFAALTDISAPRMEYLARQVEMQTARNLGFLSPS